MALALGDILLSVLGKESANGAGTVAVAQRRHHALATRR